MKSLLILLLSAALVSGQSTGDYLFQRKTSTGYAPQNVTPQNGKVLSWNGSGQIANIDLPTSATWGNITGTLSSQTDLQSALNAKQNSMIGVVVTKKDGTRTTYAPSADTDTARGLALEAAFAAAIAGDTIDLSPGNYYVAKATSTISAIVAQYGILDRMTIRLNGARLYKKATDTASCMFSANATSGIDDWAIVGPGIIEGSYAATSDTTARGAAAAEIGINVTACRRWRVDGISFLNIAGTGLQGNSATFAADEYTGGGSDKIATGHIHSCNFDISNVGLANYSGNEYWLITNSTFNKNLTGCDIYAGNTKLVACDASRNTNYVIRIRNGGNDGHGSWVGGTISHNSGFSVAAEASMDNGFLFLGVHFYADSNSTNKIQSLGGGVSLIGCTVDSPFYASATPTGINVMKNCHIPGSYTVITDLVAAERAKWKFQNNHTLTGVWASDDIRTTYADDTAAGVGGVLTGELWQQTTTGSVFVKQ